MPSSARSIGGLPPPARTPDPGGPWTSRLIRTCPRGSQRPGFMHCPLTGPSPGACLPTHVQSVSAEAGRQRTRTRSNRIHTHASGNLKDPQLATALQPGTGSVQLLRISTEARQPATANFFPRTQHVPRPPRSRGRCVPWAGLQQGIRATGVSTGELSGQSIRTHQQQQLTLISLSEEHSSVQHETLGGQLAHVGSFTTFNISVSRCLSGDSLGGPC